MLSDDNHLHNLTPSPQNYAISKNTPFDPKPSYTAKNSNKSSFPPFQAAQQPFQQPSTYGLGPSTYGLGQQPSTFGLGQQPSTYGLGQKTSTYLQNIPINKEAEKPEFSLDDPLINSINFYLIGYKDDTEAYFKIMKEKFNFLKEINTNFKNLKNDILSNVISFEKPCLAITLSLDYLGRAPDKWSEITNFIYEKSGNNNIFLFLKNFQREIMLS